MEGSMARLLYTGGKSRSRKLMPRMELRTCSSTSSTGHTSAGKRPMALSARLQCTAMRNSASSDSAILSSAVKGTLHSLAEKERE